MSADYSFLTQAVREGHLRELLELLDDGKEATNYAIDAVAFEDEDPINEAFGKILTALEAATRYFDGELARVRELVS